MSLNSETRATQMGLGSRIEENFGLFIPYRLGEGLAKCPSHYFKFSLGPNLWYTFDEDRFAVWEIRNDPIYKRTSAFLKTWSTTWRAA